MPKQKSISNTIDKELEKEKEKHMLAFHMQESNELMLPNLDVYTSLLFSLFSFLYVFFFFERNFCSCLDVIIIFIFPFAPPPKHVYTNILFLFI